MTSPENDGGLDDLFSFGDPAPAEPELPPAEKKKSPAGFIIRNVLLIAACTTVTVAGLRSAGMSTSILLIVCAFVALRLLMLAVSQVAPPPLPNRRRGRTMSESDNEYDYRFGNTDSLRGAVRQWERRLDWSQSDSDAFTRSLLPVLAELTDERLRLRHGITRSSDPRRARELLGDEFWQLLHQPGKRAPKQREMAGYVETLERL